MQRVGSVVRSPEEVNTAVTELVYQSCAQHALEPQAEHMEGVLNRLADWLSRRQLARFEQLIRARYSLHTRIH